MYSLDMILDPPSVLQLDDGLLGGPLLDRDTGRTSVLDLGIESERQYSRLEKLWYLRVNLVHDTKQRIRFRRHG